MILDHLHNAHLYYPLSPRIARALQALESGELQHKPHGRHDIEGSEIFALPQGYITKPHAQGKWEAHRQYIDIQYIVSGTEVMGYAPLSALRITEPYNVEKDVLFAVGSGDLLTVSAGMFALFFPHDAHMPTLAPDNLPGPVEKIVIKIQIA